MYKGGHNSKLSFLLANLDSSKLYEITNITFSYHVRYFKVKYLQISYGLQIESLINVLLNTLSSGDIWS